MDLVIDPRARAADTSKREERVAETMRLRTGWLALAGVFALVTVGTLGLIVAEMRYVSEQLIAVQERQDALERQLVAERTRTLDAGGEARTVAAEARERAAAERVARLEAVVRGLEERSGKVPPPGVTQPPVVTPPRAVTPSLPARAPVTAPRLAASSTPAHAAATPSAATPRTPRPSAPVADDELSPKPAPLVKPANMRRQEQSPGPQPKLFAEPSQPSQPLADRRLGL
jgi:hypothetical protein